MPRRFPPPWSVEEQQACDADHRHYCCQGVRNQQLGSSRLGGIHVVDPQELQADLKYPGYAVMIAPTNCKDCDCAQRLLRCQKATAVEQYPTIFV